MEKDLYNKHIEIGLLSGQERTCGKKQRFETEEKAIKAVSHHNVWEKRNHDVEHYPCAFCCLWHIGRIMDVQLIADSV